MLLSYEESFRQVRQRGEDVATEILSARGLPFRKSLSRRDADQIYAQHVRRFVAEEDIEAASACLMQFGDFLPADLVGQYCQWLCRSGDDLFYDDGDSETALRLFQLASGLDPTNEAAVRGVMTVCLQGSPQRPAAALPYSVLQARIRPERDETAYILRLIAQGDEHNSQESEKKPVRDQSDQWCGTAGGNPSRTGIVPVTIRPPLATRWAFKGDDWFQGGIVVADSTVVAGDRSGKVYALELETGDKRWEYQLKGIIAGTPSIWGGRVYLGNPDHVVSLELSTGELVWEFLSGQERVGIDAEFAMNGCLFCTDGLLVISDNHTVVLDPTTGNQIQDLKSAVDACINTGACGDGENLFIPGYKKLMKVTLESGGAITTQTEGKIMSGPMIADDLVIYGNNRASVWAHSINDLRRCWSFTVEGESALGFVLSRPACSDGRIFFGGPDGNVYALDGKTGSLKWKTKIGGELESSPLVSGDTVYAIGPAGLYALSVQNGEIFWQHDIGRNQLSATASFGGNMILMGYDKLYAFGSES